MTNHDPIPTVGIGSVSSWPGKDCAMRMEAKVYMSHTDMHRIQSAAKVMGMTISGYMRWSSLRVADESGIPAFRTIEELDGQLKLLEQETEKLTALNGGR